MNKTSQKFELAISGIRHCEEMHRINAAIRKIRHGSLHSVRNDGLPQHPTHE